MRVEFKTCSERVVACGATGHVVLEQAGQVLRRLPHALHHLPLEQLAVQLAHLRRCTCRGLLCTTTHRPLEGKSGKPITLQGETAAAPS